MATTRTLADGAVTATVRGTPNPTTEYDYAAVANLEGPFDVLVRHSAEAAARDALSTRRDASWTWSEEGALVLEFTRGDPGYAAEVAAAVLDGFEEHFEAIRERADDPAFDDALAALER